MHARWANSTPDETTSAQSTVMKPECVATTTTAVVPTTTTAVAPTTTTTVAPTTTSTIAPTATTVAVTTTTVAVVTTQAGAQFEGGQVSAEETPAALPATGTISAPLIVAGASLLLIGTALVLAARRRGATV